MLDGEDARGGVADQMSRDKHGQTQLVREITGPLDEDEEEESNLNPDT